MSNEKMNKDVFAKQVAEELAKSQNIHTKITPDMVKEIWDTMVAVILRNIKEGRKILLTGFGSFFLQKHAGHSVQFKNTDDKINGYVNIKFAASNKLNRELREEYRENKIKAYK